MFKLDPNEELRKAVVEKKSHSIFRLVNCDDDLRKAVLEKTCTVSRRLCPNIENVSQDIRK